MLLRSTHKQMTRETLQGCSEQTNQPDLDRSHLEGLERRESYTGLEQSSVASAAHP